MLPMNETETWPILLLGAAVVLVLLLIACVSFFNEFRKELRYLNVEIHRTEGEEQRHYIRRRRRLWLSLIPFVRY